MRPSGFRTGSPSMMTRVSPGFRSRKIRRRAASSVPAATIAASVDARAAARFSKSSITSGSERLSFRFLGVPAIASRSFSKSDHARYGIGNHKTNNSASSGDLGDNALNNCTVTPYSLFRCSHPVQSNKAAPKNKDGPNADRSGMVTIRRRISFALGIRRRKPRRAIVIIFVNGLRSGGHRLFLLRRPASFGLEKLLQGNFDHISFRRLVFLFANELIQRSEEGWIEPQTDGLAGPIGFYRLLISLGHELHHKDAFALRGSPTVRMALHANHYDTRNAVASK